MLANKEIKNLITALGAGIGLVGGETDIDLNKLRYHTIAIMTDADVDGAHIRTLLLTFFFRQYKELIEKGYLYIAQPPLYRVHTSKFEKFIKDDTELNKFLLDRISKDAFIKSTANGHVYEGKAIIKLAKDISLIRSRLRDAEIAGINEPLFLALMQYDTLLEPQWFMEDSIELSAFRDWIREQGFSLRVETEETELEQLRRIVFEDKNGHRTKLGVEFFKSKMYRSTWQVREDIRKECQGLSFILERKEISIEVEGLFNLERMLLEEARRGLNIQRYKGLGEMNPEQLWVTTMNPENRILLQVRIEDAEEASEAFEELMGDRVEARREFIERNALSVQDLDI